MDAILITGPTASGKSALALALARENGGVIVNADSMQVYDTLRLLTARPGEDEMAAVPHFLFGHVPAGATYSTGQWLRDVAELLPRLKREGRLPVFVGGTGLYFRALGGGLSDIPEVSQAVRCHMRLRLSQEGPAALHGELVMRDPQVAAMLGLQDGQRIVRALEVLEETGSSIASFQARRGPVLVDPQRARKIVLVPDRQLLRRRIGERFAAMIDHGAVEEVRALLAIGASADAPAMRAIGVAEIAAMLEGRMTREEALERAVTLTRQYAKRQMTWFRNQMDDSWERLAP